MRKNKKKQNQTLLNKIHKNNNTKWISKNSNLNLNLESKAKIKYNNKYKVHKTVHLRRNLLIQ